MFSILIEFGKLIFVSLFDLNITYEVLLKLRVSLLAVNHSFTFFSISLAVSISRSILELWKNMPVSSAKILKSPFLHEFAMSLMYIIKSRGPSTDPCGTPQEKGFIHEYSLFTLQIAVY